jgi:hypothetical protein
MRKESVKLELCLSALLEKKFMSCKKYFWKSWDWYNQNCFYITTYGASNMVGKQTGFKKLFTDLIGHPVTPFNCIIYQVALCATYGFLKF